MPLITEYTVRARPDRRVVEVYDADAYLGDGDDTFKWDNGEGSDVVEGQDGHDTMVFNGAGINETVSLTAKDGRLNFFRVQGNVTMDTDGVEQVDDNTFGGSDSVTVNRWRSARRAYPARIDLANSIRPTMGSRAKLRAPSWSRETIPSR